MVRKETYSRVDNLDNLTPEVLHVVKTLLTYAGCTFVTFYERGGDESVSGYTGSQIQPQPNEIIFIEQGTWESKRSGGRKATAAEEVRCGKKVIVPLDTARRLEAHHVFSKERVKRVKR